MHYLSVWSMESAAVYIWLWTGHLAAQVSLPPEIGLQDKNMLIPGG